ncbi:IclR family transcriptional regulator [Paenibacillus sp. J31TS4]|uniref:IclR family transcriptional regulator n=1 Tax=Paenibacillus sp. J31TS4 TaxID=2807195 RepID=UPI001B0D85BA|nr:IclR family transcriptional regulator [Paenibacillus sp. J31TS4]GIP37575.1 IclR family transcriptional regulator [Paenibacillus sp. J31TS4]
MTNPPAKVKSADRVLDILELFGGAAESYTLTEIAKLLEMPPSSTYQILRNLLIRGYLETDKSEKSFRLGYKLFEIRARYMKGTSLAAEFYRVTDKVVEDLNETVFLGIKGGDRLIYVAEKQISQPLRFGSHLGTSLPLYATASGKILLCNYTDEEIRAMYPSGILETFTPNTLSSVDRLLEQLREVRETGLGYNYGETVDGVQCIGGPIYDAEGRIVASISISIPVIRVTPAIWEKAEHWVQTTCRELSYKVFVQQ